MQREDDFILIVCDTFFLYSFKISNFFFFLELRRQRKINSCHIFLIKYVSYNLKKKRVKIKSLKNNI